MGLPTTKPPSKADALKLDEANLSKYSSRSLSNEGQDGELSCRRSRSLSCGELDDETEAPLDVGVELSNDTNEHLSAEDHWSGDYRESTVENEVYNQLTRINPDRSKRGQLSNQYHDDANFCADSSDEDTERRERSLYRCRGVVRNDAGNLQVVHEAQHYQGDDTHSDEGDVPAPPPPPPPPPLDGNWKSTRKRQRLSAEDEHEPVNETSLDKLAVEKLRIQVSEERVDDEQLLQVDEGDGTESRVRSTEKIQVTLEDGLRRGKRREFLNCALIESLPRRIPKDVAKVVLYTSDLGDDSLIQDYGVEEILPETELASKSPKQGPRELLEYVLIPLPRRKQVEERRNALPSKNTVEQVELQQQQQL